jgi:hypothetical protein
MIGLLISMSVILTSLTLFKSLVVISMKAKQDAFQDGELSTGFTSLQMMIQSAGFGLDTGATPHVSLGKTNLSSNQDALLWRYMEGTTLTCKGALEVAATDSATQKPMRVVKALTATNCSLTAPLASMTWSSTSDLTRFKNIDTPMSRFTLETKACTPFGMGGDKSIHYVANLFGTSSAQRAGAPGVESIHYSVCLSNLSAS